MNQSESMGQPFRQRGASRYLSTASIAARLNITTRSVRLWAECGEIPAVKFGRQWRFDQQAFEEWLAARTGAAPVRSRASGS
jgi:excisionase family DNA binding protein